MTTIVFEAPRSVLDPNLPEMNKIIFNGPASKFNPTLSKSRNPVAGVYIVGVKIKVVDSDGKCEKFCPLYVGKHQSNLPSRIMAHQKLNGGYLNEKKELFKLQKNMRIVYEDIKLWNKNWGMLSSSSKTLLNKKKLYDKIKKKNNTLIWFNSSSFFDDYLGLRSGTSRYQDGKNHAYSTIRDLPTIAVANPKSHAKALITGISSTKDIITSNFCFAWWVLPYGIPISELEKIEASTKYALEKLKLFTYGHVSGSGKTVYTHLKNRVPSFPIYSIDMSKLTLYKI